jgi:hypothetical protein
MVIRDKVKTCVVAVQAAAQAVGVALLAAGPAVAQQEGGQSLDQAASDPTASLMSFQLQNFYSYDLQNSGGTANRLQFRAAIPFQIAGYNNIARLTLPYVKDSASGADGFGDTTIFNLTAFDRPWGRWGVGVVGLIPTGASGVSAEKWAVGPAAGFTVQADSILWGVFNQNLFSFAGDDARRDVNISTLQPIFNIGLGNGWSTGLSEMVFTYDWEADEFTSLPLGVKLSKLIRFGDTPVQFVGSYEHEFFDEGVVQADTISFTVKVLLPRG